MAYTMVKRGLACVALLAMAGPALGRDEDPRAVRTAEAMIKAMGGEKAYQAARYLRFDFIVMHSDRASPAASHLWDRYTGRYRLGWSRDGKKYQVLFNVNTREGKAFADGQPVAEENLRLALEAAYGRFINDTYWLLMPFKLLDPGVRLTYEGRTKEAGLVYDVLALSFDEGVGLTPKDRYWAYVNPQTHIMEKWKFVLRGQEVAPTTFLWRDWKVHRGVKLAAEKINPETGDRILHPVIDLPEEVDDQVFEDPERPMP